MGSIYSHHLFVPFLPILQTQNHITCFSQARSFRSFSTFPASSGSLVNVLLTWSCWVSIPILFCSAICCPGLLWWWVLEEEVMPRGGDRAPKASFSRKTSLDNSVICKESHQTSDLPPDYFKGAVVDIIAPLDVVHCAACTPQQIG